MADHAIHATSTEGLRAGMAVANPRRLRVGRDGRPLPPPEHPGEEQPSG